MLGTSIAAVGVVQKVARDHYLVSRYDIKRVIKRVIKLDHVM